ncbi:MAG: propane 2-monooxygenase small subunit [Thermoleophilaceae bacterium]|jgi:hypothetical protein|nr:propane 2-monooxygenase small subunit [Thermoleophilaceae bacterium]
MTDERSFQWFTPTKRRASIYEDVTMDTQPSVHRFLERGWQMCFDDGAPTWSDDSTALKSTSWFDFRDPGEQWERPFYQRGAGSERQIEGAVKGAADDGLFADFDADWIAFLRNHLQVPAFIDHGIWLPTAIAARACLSDSITHCVAIEASMKQRSAQALVLYAMDLEPHLGEFPIESCRKSWLEHEAWQPSRAYIEKLGTITDWGELIVAANACFEPAVGMLVRRELGMRAASANGDTVTPVIFRAAAQESQWIKEWTGELMRFAAADEQNGAANKELIAGWAADWLPQAEEAARAIAPIAAELPKAIDFDAAVTAGIGEARAVFEEAGVALPQAVGA